MSRNGRGRRALTLVVLGAVWCTAVILAYVEIAGVADNHGVGSDFVWTIYNPAQAVIHGSSPYGDPHEPGLLVGSVYPPSAFVPGVWLGFLSHDVAIALWLLLLSIATIATLWVIGVRDWRCYGLWLLNPMVLSTLVIGNATILVLFLVALLWKWRDAPVRAAIALGGAVAIKLFAAPLIVWLLATRRYKAALLTVVVAATAVLSAWAAIGFSAIERYPSILNANSDVFSRSGPFLEGLLLQLHYSRTAASVVGLCVGATLLAASFAVGEIEGLALAICGTIIATPVAWIGYAGLLVIPLAVIWRRWGPAWLVLVGTYAHWYASPLPFRSVSLSVLTLGLLALIAAIVLRGSRGPMLNTRLGAASLARPARASVR